MTRLQEIPAEYADADSIYEAFGQYCADLGIELYPAQDEAILSILAEDNTIVATPTGSGKSLVALAALYQSFTRGIRAYYTAPLKALVSEKFFSLVNAFGPENVGMITGDTTVNGDAPVICATAEILANQALREGGMLDVGTVVMDEFHYFADPARGWAWQVPLLEMPQAQFVLMSATLGDTTEIRTTLAETTGRDSAVITSATRPVPLDYEYSMETLSDTLRDLVRHDKAPVYVVSFAQAVAVELATGLLSVDLAAKEQKAAIAAEIKGFTFSKGFGQTLRRLLLHGVGVHHAGMLPKYRRLVEQLALKGLLLVISGTDTLGVGINVPIRSVLLTGLTKFDGRKMRKLSVREFQQLAGRAGRAGFDTQGYVIAQAPEHEIENKRAAAKAENSGKKKKLKKKAPPVGFVGWSAETYEKLITGQAEALHSRMRIDHSMILNLIARPGATVSTISNFIDRTHESRERRLDLKLTAIRIGRSLIDAGLIDTGAGKLRPTEDLGPQFALNQPLAPFVLAGLELLDAESTDFALDVVSLVEACTPVTFSVLKGQLDRIKGDTLAELKAEGIEYAERMAILDEVTGPKPLAEVLDPSFDAYVEAHPWLRGAPFEPKSIVRDMLDQAMGFTQFVSYYGIARAEGNLLRYLTDVFRALSHNVPAETRTEELETIIEWLGETIARTDSSLLDEWRALQGLDPTSLGIDTDLPSPDRKFSDNRKIFTAEVRNALFHRVLLAERADYAELGRLDGQAGFDAPTWENAIEDFYDEYGELHVDQRARSREYLVITEGSDIWRVRQILADPDDNKDWAIDAEVDVAASDAAGEIALTVVHVGEISASPAQSAHRS